MHSWQATDGSADVLRTYTVPANKRPLDPDDDELEGQGAAMSTDGPSSAEAAGRTWRPGKHMNKRAFGIGRLTSARLSLGGGPACSSERGEAGTRSR